MFSSPISITFQLIDGRIKLLLECNQSSLKKCWARLNKPKLVEKKKSTYSQRVQPHITKTIIRSRELNVERLFLLHFDILHGIHTLCIRYYSSVWRGYCEPLLYTFMVVSHLSKANTVRFSSKYITRGIFIPKLVCFDLSQENIGKSVVAEQRETN